MKVNLFSIKHDFYFLLDSDEEKQKGLEVVKRQIGPKDTAEVFYISLLASKKEKGLPEKEHFLFDVASSLELSGYNVQFVSTHELKQFFIAENGEPASRGINTYQLTTHFIQRHPGGSFFLDEVPFLSNSYRK